ncbi:MAG: hypothetical protein C0403_17115 [Desulfobacterium sp.]|nr:hypothetical protein [Desulfobacterium sp.]
MNRNHCPEWIGMSVRIKSESVSGFERNIHRAVKMPSDKMGLCPLHASRQPGTQKQGKRRG